MFRNSTKIIWKVSTYDMLWKRNAIVYLKQLKKSLPSNVDNSTLSFTPSRTHCSFCGVVHNPPNIKVNPCSGCHCVFYCCKEHQIMDWKLSKYGGDGHKEYCKQLQIYTTVVNNITNRSI